MLKKACQKIDMFFNLILTKGWRVVNSTDEDIDLKDLDSYSTTSVPVLLNFSIPSNVSELPEELQDVAPYLTFDRNDLELILNLTEVQ